VGGSVNKTRVALVAILVLAAGLRFTGLSWGLRHRPHWDERVFVENAARMADRHELDHRFYEYPGLFFDLLAPVFALAGAGQPDARAYLVARAVVAAFGTASVLMVFLLGRRLMDERAGLVAALLLAVSPIDVWTAHMVRPDVPLQTLVLVAFLAFGTLGARARGDVLSGLAVGAATAVKFTGLLLVPSYLAARALARGPRLRNTLLAGVLGLAVLLAATPYAVLRAGPFFGGLKTQWAFHYGTGGFSDLAGYAAYYGRAILTTLGPLGAALAAIGAVLAARDWRSWLPLLLHPLVTLAVHSTAEVRYDRFLVPTTGVLCLLAARPLARPLALRPGAAWGLSLVAALVPFLRSAAYVIEVSRPSTWDRALDWTLASAAPGARIVASDPDVGLDHRRFEVLTAAGSEARDRLLVRSADLVLWAGTPPGLESLTPALVADPRGVHGGPRVLGYRVPDSMRPRYAPVPLDGVRLSASENPEEVELVRDGDLTSAWSTAGPQRPGQWFQVELPAPRTLARVRLLLGFHPLRRARDLHVMVSDDGRQWRQIPSASGRAPVDEQDGSRGFEEALLLEPTPTRFLRLDQVGSGERRWGFAELRLDVLQ
jgi:4-amino-4-deoxy-L-arabinose transferase-like glycosyltransferase